MTIDSILSDTTIVAVVFRQALEPVEGRDVPVFPATYPTPKGSDHRHGTPYTLNELKDGTRSVSLDSVQSQANRMEAVFHGEFADTVPRVMVDAGGHVVQLTELSHRLADAAVRCTALEGEIHDAFEAFAAGDPLPIARLGPTSLVYGAWDSRDTQVKIPRLIRAEIIARDVDVFTRSAQFTGAFKREELGFSEAEWKKGAELGFAPTPSVNQHGGVLVHGEIVHSAAIHLGALRGLRDQTDDWVLARYALGLALVGLLHGARDYRLRAGCWLVPAAPAEFESVHVDGTRGRTELDAAEVARSLRTAAETAKARLGIPAGEKRVVKFDPAAGKKVLKAKTPAAS